MMTTTVYSLTWYHFILFNIHYLPSVYNVFLDFIFSSTSFYVTLYPLLFNSIYISDLIVLIIKSSLFFINLSISKGFLLFLSSSSIYIRIFSYLFSSFSFFVILFFSFAVYVTFIQCFSFFSSSYSFYSLGFLLFFSSSSYVFIIFSNTSSIKSLFG